MNFSVVSCILIYNNEDILEDIFNNLNKLYKLFNSFNVIFSYKKSNDKSLFLLHKYKIQNKDKFNVDIINNIGYNSNFQIRNSYLKLIETKYNNIDYHIVIEANTINTKPWNIDTIKNCFNDNWDAITFNRENYNDNSTILFNKYIIPYSCFNNIPFNIFIQKTINKKLTKYKYFNCKSLYNNFCIYKTNRFLKLRYNNNWNKLKSYYTINELTESIFKINNKINEKLIFKPNTNNNGIISEHIYYNYSAYKENNVTFKFSSKII